MTELANRIEGIAAPIEIANLDTDQIMPKQFLHGIDKSGLDQGLLWDHRFTGDGQLKPDFILNSPAYADTRVLIAGPNFGCGSSREHAVWGLQQFGIQAVIASAYGEIFYSNAMNNRLLAVMLAEEEVQALLGESRQSSTPLRVSVDVETMTVKSPQHAFAFTMSARHRTMFLQGLDMIGASLSHKAEIQAFAAQHWQAQPWVKDVAGRTKARLDAH
ncbi:3-isopropylmalate dehydratase small subunit [Variovorax sp. J22P240]|uniref:3-isopropylmalate dehydratase small subunit n=1 Tax=Variovorax sp. J22P240 TaxID=3053514 RepID=UPI0025772050|nr:3-isopropylmalate dehydratase small subunit [Variovorax sp. J22P240]MDM0001098.1 3-isopropylmalate dehydratase small subunit [Variovorax sp. J22P240]